MFVLSQMRNCELAKQEFEDFADQKYHRKSLHFGEKANFDFLKSLHFGEKANFDTNVNWMKSCKSIKTKCKNKFTDKMFCTKHKSQSFTLINTIIFFIEYYQNLFRYQPNMIKTSHSRNILETRNTGKRTKPKFCFS